MLVSVRAEFHRDRVLLVRENPVQWMYEKSRTRGRRLESLEGKRKEGKRGKKKNFDCSKKTRQGEGEEGNFKDIATVIFNDLGICSRDRSS